MSDLTEDGGEQAIMVAAQEPSSVQVPDVSSRLGELLLQGYAMLAETCPDCPVPLMRRPGTTDMLCVQCGKTSTTDRVAEQDAPHAQNQVVEEAAQVDSAAPAVPRSPLAASTVRGPLAADSPSAPPASDPAGADAQDASQTLAEYMLRGWALLQEQCPLCGTLLIRSRSGERRCVSCAMPVRSSGEAAASSSTAARESTPSRARDGPGPTQAPRVLSSETVDPTGLASVNPPSSAPSRDAAASVEGASHAVALALHGATRRLEDLRLTPPVSGGAEERERAVQAVLGTVQQCAQALASLHACQSAAAALRWTTR